MLETHSSLMNVNFFFRHCLTFSHSLLLSCNQWRVREETDLCKCSRPNRQLTNNLLVAREFEICWKPSVISFYNYTWVWNVVVKLDATWLTKSWSRHIRRYSAGRMDVIEYWWARQRISKREVEGRRISMTRGGFLDHSERVDGNSDIRQRTASRRSVFISYFLPKCSMVLSKLTLTGFFLI